MNAAGVRLLSSPTAQNQPELGHITTTVPQAAIHCLSTTDSGTTAWRQQQRNDQSDLNKGEFGTIVFFEGDLLECMILFEFA